MSFSICLIPSQGSLITFSLSLFSFAYQPCLCNYPEHAKAAMGKAELFNIHTKQILSFFPSPCGTGIWSPSTTPQPVRRGIPTESGQFKSEPSLVHSTPSTPAAERREFRSVKFESPIVPRRNLVKSYKIQTNLAKHINFILITLFCHVQTQQPHTGSTPSLTQPTITVQPPPPSPKFKGRLHHFPSLKNGNDSWLSMSINRNQCHK